MEAGVKNKDPRWLTKPGEYKMPAACARAYGRLGGASVRQMHMYLIEGEHVTTLDIAKRLGLSQSHACNLLVKAKKMPGALTWAQLNEARGRKHG